MSSKNPTQHQRAILKLMVHGFTSQEIRAALKLKSQHAVRRALGNMRAKYELTTPSLIALAIRLEWVSFHIHIARPVKKQNPRP